MSSTSYLDKANPKPISELLLALKPRQVQLAELAASPTMKPSTENRYIFIHSILCFLDSNSFSKTLKRFLSEAQIQDDSWKACSVNLEEIFLKNYVTCDTKSIMLDKEVQPEIKVAAAEGNVKKKKKKKNDVIEELNPIGKDNNLEMNEQNKKEKDKKKRKHKSDPELQELGKKPEHAEEKVKKKKNKVDKSSLEDGEKEVKVVKEKSKDKKKKNKHLVEKCSSEGDNIKEEASIKEKSKKRKRSLSEENIENEVMQESKISDPILELNSIKGDNGKLEKKKSVENGHASEDQLQDSSVRRQNNEENDSDAGRSTKKQRTESAEPTTAAKAFRRVKVEEVVFSDDRLQDNSYWAKDGADIGYGAKAQEVLGQVKGRGFRHEKTKKKRGSYRGGQIDLDSHSIKFNYSDDE